MARPNTPEDPLVSTVTPSYNSARTVEILLSSIKKQTYSNIETIIVDNYSKDSTLEIGKKYGASVISSKCGRSEARNIGAKCAKGDYLLFLDSDLELTPFVVERCVRVCEANKLSGIIIPEESKGNSFWAKCRSLEKLAYLNDKHKISILFMRKSVFDDLKGYDENLVAAEDYDLNMRFYERGYKCTMINVVMYHHEVTSLFDLLKKSYKYGKTMPSYIKKRPRNFMEQFFPIRLSYFSGEQSLAGNSIYMLGIATMKTLQYLAAILGVLASKFIH